MKLVYATDCYTLNSFFSLFSLRLWRTESQLWWNMPSKQKAEAGGSLQTQGHPGLAIEFQVRNSEILCKRRVGKVSSSSLLHTSKVLFLFLMFTLFNVLHGWRSGDIFQESAVSFHHGFQVTRLSGKHFHWLSNTLALFLYMVPAVEGYPTYKTSPSYALFCTRRYVKENILLENMFQRWVCWHMLMISPLWK